MSNSKSDNDEPNNADAAGNDATLVVQFPLSRVRPRGSRGPAKQLGFGKMAQAIGMPREQTSGHWCSHCQGIWFGYLLEVECPVCGNRSG